MASVSASDSDAGFLRTDGTRLVDGTGRAVQLRGVGLGGWMNMENFITGYPANESMMRSAVTEVLGREKAEVFFERLLEVFFTGADADLLASAGLNSVRLPVNYRHFEVAARPFDRLVWIVSIQNSLLMKPVAHDSHFAGNPSALICSSVLPAAMRERTIPVVSTSIAWKALRSSTVASGPWPGMIFAPAGALAITFATLRV